MTKPLDFSLLHQPLDLPPPGPRASVAPAPRCPCCGQPLPAAPPRSRNEELAWVLSSLPLPLFQRRLLDRLLKSFGSFVVKSLLHDCLWYDRADGGPRTANSVLNVEISHLRKKLAGSGLVIETAGRGTGTAGWRLTWRSPGSS